MADVSAIFGGAAADTFMGFPAEKLDTVRKGDIVVLGVPAATPYASTGNYCDKAPAAIRKAVAKHANARHHIDFDLGGTVDADGRRRIVDCGDLAWDAKDHAGNRARISAAVSRILAAGAVPIVLGGDDSVPIPVLAGYAAHGPITIVQIDAHIDWRDEVQGERIGLSSTMRRASEMAHVARMVQIGQRGIGSARPSDYEDAKKWGAHFVAARTLHERGIEAAVAAVPAGSNVFINFDVDALDPSIMAAVIGPVPGGLLFHQATGLIAAVAAKAQIAGFSIVELATERDQTGLSALVSARLVANVLGLCARQ